MQVDRALRAFLRAGADAAGALLRWGAQRALDMVTGPSRDAPAAPSDRGPLHEDGRQTVRFGLDGVHYEIDLRDERPTELRSALQRYVDAGAGSARSRD